MFLCVAQHTLCTELFAQQVFLTDSSKLWQAVSLGSESQYSVLNLTCQHRLSRSISKATEDSDICRHVEWIWDTPVSTECAIGIAVHRLFPEFITYSTVNNTMRKYMNTKISKATTIFHFGPMYSLLCLELSFG